MSNNDTGSVGATLTGTGWLMGAPLNRAGDLRELDTNGNVAATLEGGGWLVGGVQPPALRFRALRMGAGKALRMGAGKALQMRR